MNLKIFSNVLRALVYFLITENVSSSSYVGGHHFCVPPAPPTGGKVNLGRGGVVVRYTCDEGFKLIGTPVAVCVTGKWSSPKPQCQPTGNLKRIPEEEQDMQQKDQQVFTISRVDIPKIEMEQTKKRLGEKKRKNRKRNRRRRKKRRKKKKSTSVTTTIGSKSANGTLKLQTKEDLVKIEKRRLRKEERRKNRKNRKRRKDRKGRKKKRRKSNKLKNSLDTSSNLFSVSPDTLEIKKRNQIKKNKKIEDNSINISFDKIRRKKQRRKFRNKFFRHTTIHPPTTSSILIPISESTTTTDYYTPHTYLEKKQEKDHSIIITTSIPNTINPLSVSKYELSSIAPVSIKKNKDFLQNIIKRMKNPQNVASNLFDALMKEKNINSIETLKPENNNLPNPTIKTEIKTDTDDENNISIYDDDYDTLPEGYPELKYDVDRNDRNNDINKKNTMLESENVNRELPNGYHRPETRLYDKKEVHAEKDRFKETEDLDFQSLDATCIISKMDSLYLPTPRVQHGHVTSFRTVTNPSRPNNVYVEAIYECDFRHRLLEAMTNRLFCEKNKWLGVLPNCVQYDTVEGNCGSDNGGCEQICDKKDDNLVCGCYRGFTLHTDAFTCRDINECVNKNGGCEGACFNKIGSHQCFCPSGYRLATNGKTCVDKNECILRNGHGPCHDTCHNTEGGYFCSCDSIPGTILGDDSHTCDDVDECAVNNGGCSHICLNTFGQIFCGCPAGFTLGADWSTCNDIDECDYPAVSKLCTYGCINTPGSYHCADLQELSKKIDIVCSDGLKLSQNGDICEDVNECDAKNFECSQTCINTHGSAHCECLDGYVIGADDKECHDINECITLRSSPCSHMCININGSYRCSCSPGMALGPDLRSCIDINECVENNGECDQLCINEIGSYRCDCKDGFALQSDEESCLDINECDKQNGNCDQLCINTNGSYECSCMDGFEMDDDFHCIDINECLVSEGANCDHECLNSEGSFECICHEGYDLHLNNSTCIDIDECGERDPCSHFCTNHQGSFLCNCPSGWFLSEDQITCYDIDECLQENAGCSHLCNNKAGSYICSCPEGLVLISGGSTFEQKHICVDVDECQINNGNCSHFCENYEGGYQCICPIGHRIDRLVNKSLTCPDINECLEDNGGCSHFCVNLRGSFECQCQRGFELGDDNKFCEDVDECQMENGGCSHDCVNLPGTHQCTCPTGWDIDYDYDYDNEATYLEGFEELLRTCVDINECDSSVVSCSHECVNEEGSFRCKCPSGFLLIDKFTCEDIDECSVAEGGCSHSCSNHEGSFECHCPKGFVLVDSTRCFDIDECQSNNGNCSYFCNNDIGSYRCSCPVGFLLETDNITCSDVNECGAFNGGCSHECHNLEGQYTCSCLKGLKLGADEHMCLDIDECKNYKDVVASGCSHTCVNTFGSFICECPPGLSVAVDERTCVDVDECGRNNGGCSHQCSNEEGHYVCLCPAGMALDDDLHTCIDINECQIWNGGCSHGCINAVIGFSCSCPRGLELGIDNATCHDIDECNIENGGCEDQCHNTRQSFRCACSKGFRLGSNGLSCDDLNECDLANGGCSHVCFNIVGSFTCQCPSGYFLNEAALKCQDIDECKDSPCEHKCHNTLGSFFCKCKHGFKPQPDAAHRCWDINECEIDNGGCDHVCYNTIGSYSCDCQEGYRLTANGHSCIEKPVYCPILVAPLGGFMKCTKDLQGQTYPLGTVCSFGCSEGAMLRGEVNTSCTPRGTWTNEVVACQEVKCAILSQVEHGRISPKRCTKRTSTVGHHCYLSCSHGYRVVGNPVRTCSFSGSWSPGTPSPFCEKATLKPFIQCPSDITVNLLPHQNMAHVKIPKPKSNVEWYRFVEASPAWAKNLEDDLPAGRTRISFIARSPMSDAKASCSFVVNVKDSEPPQVFGCPKSFYVHLKPYEISTEAAWVEPVFKDNVAISHVYKSMEPGQKLQAGTHPVYYVAVDSQRNRAKCSFVITVEAGPPVQRLYQSNRVWVACPGLNGGKPTHMYVSLVPQGCSVTNPSSIARLAQWDSTLTHSKVHSVSNAAGEGPRQKSGPTRGASVYDVEAMAQSSSIHGKNVIDGGQSLSSSTAFAMNRHGGNSMKTRHHHSLHSFYGNEESPQFSHLFQGAHSLAIAHARAGGGRSPSEALTGSAFAHAQSNRENSRAMAYAKASVYKN